MCIKRWQLALIIFSTLNNTEIAKDASSQLSEDCPYCQLGDTSLFLQLEGSI